MVDHVTLSTGLGHGWNLCFGQLCDWKLDEAAILAATLKALKRQLKKFGNNPIQLITRVYMESFAWLPTPLFDHAINVAKEIERVEIHARDLRGNKRGMGIAQQVCVRRIYSLGNSGFVNSDHHFGLTRAYVGDVYASEYEGRISAGKVKLPSEVTQAELESRLCLLRPQLESGFDSFAYQLVKHGNVEKLRMPPIGEKVADADYLNEDIRLG